MRVLVTGAFGFLGGRLAEHLRAGGAEVVLSGRAIPERAASWAEGFEVRLADLQDPAQIRALPRGTDAVVHLASLDEHEAAADPERALVISAGATRRLLDATRASGGTRFVFFSTFHVYGPTVTMGGAQGPPHAPLVRQVIDEDTPTRAAHPYSIAHLAGEGFCRQAHAAGLPSVILRVSNGYGAPTRVDVDRWTLAHNDFCRQAVRTGRIVLKTSGAQPRDFVWVGDVARAAELILAAPREALGEGVFNVGGSHSLSILALAELVRARATLALGREVTIERPVSSGGDAPIPPVTLSVARLRALGYAPTDRLADETDRLLRLLLEDARA